MSAYYLSSFIGKRLLVKKAVPVFRNSFSTTPLFFIVDGELTPPIHSYVFDRKGGYLAMIPWGSSGAFYYFPLSSEYFDKSDFVGIDTASVVDKKKAQKLADASNSLPMVYLVRALAVLSVVVLARPLVSLVKTFKRA